MRKFYTPLLIIFLTFFGGKAYSQASAYSFAASNGTYTEVTDATATRITGVEADTYISSAQNIGFNFVYEGISYSQFTMSSNGFISLGGANTSSLTTNDFSTANAASRPILAPLWDDLDGRATGSVSRAFYELTGSAPNRVLTVEWRNWEWNYGSSTPVISFQVKLYETSNNIDFVYRSETGSVNSGSASIGIGSATGSGSGSYLNLTSVATPAVSSTTSMTTISTKPATGQIYTFSPPAACNSTPVPGTASTTTTSAVCPGTTATIVLSGTSAASALTYQWQISATGAGSWSNINGATSNSLTLGVPNQTSDYRCVVTCTPTSQSANSNIVTINVNTAAYVPLPFSEGFESTWIDGCGAAGSKSIPTSNWANNPVTGNNSWRRNDETTANSGWSSTSGSYTPVGANSSSHSARIHTYSTSSSGNFDLFVNCSVGSSAKQLSYSYINAGGSDSLKVFLSTDGGLAFSPLGTKNVVSAAWSNIVVPFTSSSATTVIRFIAYGDAGSSDIGLDEVNVITLTACSGTPPALTIAGASAVCSGYNSTLTATGFDLTISGIVYRWQSSTDNINWTNTNGTNPASFTVNQTVATYYRLVDTCLTSNQSAISNVIQLAILPASYAPLPFTEGFEGTWINGCGTADIPNNSWRNRPVSSDSSWRREDDAPSGGNTANWNNTTSYLYSPAFSQGAHSARFHSGYVNNRSRGIMDLYLDCSAGNASKQLSFDYINIDGTDSLTVFVSTDAGASFTRLDTVYKRAAWNNKTILFTSSSATTIVRFMATGDYGSTDIGMDNIAVIALTGCSGTPVAGTVTGPVSTVCTGVTFNLTATGYSPTSAGLTYRWQSSTDNINWVNTTGTTPSAFSTSVTVNTWFRLVDTCTSGNAFAVSNAVLATVNAPTYATLPFTEGFESTWINGCGTADVPSNSWRNRPVSSDSSWRREDDAPSGGNTASWNNTTYYLYSPAFSQGAHSARFHSGYVNNRSRGIMDLYLDCSAGNASKQLSFDYINIDGTDSLTVFVSTDAGASFTRLDTVYKRAAWSNKTILFASSSATTIVRFMATGDYGSTDIGMDNIAVIVLTGCSGTPVAATVTGPASAVCGGATFTLSATGYPSASVTGITYRWQSSTDNINWVNTTGTTPASFATSTNVNTYYRLVDTCTNGNAFAVSNVVLVTINAATYAAVPFTEGFEATWIDGCGTTGSKSIPNNSWRNTPTTGNNSWRRNDESTTNSGWTSTSGAYSPTFTEGAYSARIHTYSTTASGSLDLYLNCSTGSATKQVSYDYINTSGSDSLRAFLSTDGGINFTPIGSKNTTVAAWTNIVVPFTSSSATTVIRFTAYGDAGSTDIGIDNLAVSLVACGTPTGTSFSAISTTGATVSWVAPGVAPASYELYHSTSNTTPTAGTIPTVTNITTTTTNLSGLTASTTYYVWVRSNCGGAGVSNWSAIATFNTACSALPVPYTQNFDGVTAPTLPVCMSVIDVNADGKTWAPTSNSSYLIGGTNSMTYTWNSAGPADDWFFTAPLTLTGGTEYTLKFIGASYTSSYFEKLEVKYGTSATVAGMTSSALYSNTAIQGPIKVQVPFTPGTTGTYYVGFHAFSATNQFFLSVDSILLDLRTAVPITLTQFKGERQGVNNVLSWTTTTEINNAGFELQRSADGINFSALAFVASKAANGNSNSSLTYTLTDTKSLIAGSYYRLKQIDKDGKSTLSSIVFIKGVKVSKLELVSIYPNPVTDKLNVIVASPKDDKVTFMVTDLAGKIIMSQLVSVNNGDNNVQLNVSTLTKGTYTVKAICANGCETAISKFIK